MKRTRYFRNATALAIFTLLYFAAGKLGLQLAFVNASASAVWPPTGIAVAGLLVLGLRFWPAVFLGAFLVNITTAGTVATSLGISAGNTLEGLAGAWLVGRFAGGRHAFDRAQDVIRFAVLAALFSTTISASLGVASLALGGLATWADFGSIWRTWWLGDVCGALVVAPLLMTWATNPRVDWNRRTLEVGGALLILLLAGGAVFGEWFPIAEKGYPFLFLLLPMMVWVGFRFAQRETATTMFVLSAVAVAGTLRGLGPFALETQNESLVFLQAFLGTITIMSMMLTAAVAERRASEQRVHAQQATTRILADSRTLAEAMPGILQVLCEKLDWEFGNYWRVSEDGEHLECVETWPQTDGAMEEFIAVSKSTQFAPGIGMPGRAWQSQSPVWIDDVVHDSNFPRAPFAEKAGLHSAFAFPISVEGRVRGILEFFTREFRGSKDELLAMVAAVGSQIGQLVERRQAEEAVKQSEALYRTMAETASDALLTINESSTILFVNRATERTFGYLAAEMVGQKLTMLMPEEMRAEHLSGLSRYLQTGRKNIPWRSVELPGRHKSGRIIPLEISFGEFEEKGHHIFTGIARDISDRKRTENMLAQHAAIVESSSDAIYSKSLQGIITSWNQAAESLYGYPASEILGKDVLLLVPPERADEERDILARVARGERIASYETVRRRKDGTSLDIALTVSPIKTGDRISGASAIARDVSERKRAAAEIERQKVAAEAANQAKDSFLAMLSHELRTPLSPVITAIDELEPTLTASPDGRAALTMIRRNIQHEARLIDDLLDLTRIVKGKLDLRREPLDAHCCIQHALDLCRSESGQKRIELRTDLHAAQHFVNADATKLHQIIWNLVKNAVKFSPEGSTISIVSENESEGVLAIHISDRGIGIEPEMLRRIFIAFEQGERSIHRRYGGLGLGLAISKALAEAHGGTLMAASGGRNLGATFTLTLGVIQADALPAKKEEPAPPPRKAPGDLRILLVEDHEDTRHALERLLRRRGYRVEGTGDVHSALALAARQPFDLLVSDIGLPDDSGLELMRQLQRTQPIKGIAVSGFGMEGDREKSKAAGFSEHLLKPVSFQDLEKAIWETASPR